MATHELPPLTIREYQPGDEHAILATFNRVFGQIDVTFRPRSLEAWRWQYERNPSGRRIFLALTEDGQVVSQYAGIGQRMHLAGGRARFSQAVDSMVHPDFRRGLKRPGFFVLTGQPYAETFCGPGPDQDVFAWGLPVWSAWRVGKAHLGYEVLRTVLKLVAPLERLDLSPDAAGVDVETVERFPDEVEAAGAARAALSGAMAVRDAAQLNWRFVEHPDHSYEIGLARRGVAVVGYAVFRRGLFDRVAGEGLVCDFVCPPEDAGARTALLAWLADRAVASNAERLVTVFPDTSPEWRSFQRQGFHAAGTMYFVVGRSFAKRYRMRWLFEHWFTTLGDTDLV